MRDQSATNQSMRSWHDHNILFHRDLCPLDKDGVRRTTEAQWPRLGTSVSGVHHCRQELSSQTRTRICIWDALANRKDTHQIHSSTRLALEKAWRPSHCSLFTALPGLRFPPLTSALFILVSLIRISRRGATCVLLLTRRTLALTQKAVTS